MIDHTLYERGDEVPEWVGDSVWEALGNDFDYRFLCPDCQENDGQWRIIVETVQYCDLVILGPDIFDVNNGESADEDDQYVDMFCPWCSTRATQELKRIVLDKLNRR